MHNRYIRACTGLYYTRLQVTDYEVPQLVLTCTHCSFQVRFIKLNRVIMVKEMTSELPIQAYSA